MYDSLDDSISFPVSVQSRSSMSGKSMCEYPFLYRKLMLSRSFSFPFSSAVAVFSSYNHNIAHHCANVNRYLIFI